MSHPSDAVFPFLHTHGNGVFEQSVGVPLRTWLAANAPERPGNCVIRLGYTVAEQHAIWAVEWADAVIARLNAPTATGPLVAPTTAAPLPPSPPPPQFPDPTFVIEGRW